MRRLNGTSAGYKASTKTQIQQKLNFKKQKPYDKKKNKNRNSEKNY